MADINEILEKVMKEDDNRKRKRPYLFGDLINAAILRIWVKKWLLIWRLLFGAYQPKTATP